MNIIEALYISLGLDASEYDKKRKDVEASLKKFGEASDKQTKLIAESGKKAAGAFSLLKVEVLGALAAFGMGAGFKAFIQDSMNAQAQTGRMAETLGVSVRSMRAYQLMAQEMGGSGEAAVATLKKVASGLAAARSGDTSFLTAGSQYGVVLNVNDNAQTTLEKLNARAYAIKQRYGGAQASQFLSLYGITDLSQQSELTESPAKFAAAYAHAMSLSGGMTKQSIAQAEQLQVQWADFMRQMENLRNNIFAKLEPVLIRLGTEFQNWLNKVDWNKVIADIGSFIDKIQALIGALGGVKGILIEIAAIKVLGWMGSIAGWVLKLRALTVALSAARAAAAAGGAAGAAGAAEGAAAGGAAAGSSLLGGAARVATEWALPIWALFHSESTGGKQRADGTYEDEVDWNSPEQQAGIARQKAEQASAAATRGMRNNNPGNIKYGDFAKRMGATGADSGGFAIFPSAQAGIAAIVANLRSYGRKGFDTPSEIAHRWSTTDQAAYTKRLASLFGGNQNQKLDMTDPKVLAALSSGIIMQENGNSSAAFAALVQSGAYVGAKPTASTSGPHQSTTNSDVHIGTLNVNAPKATDANGVAMGMRKALRSHPLIQGSVTAAA